MEWKDGSIDWIALKDLKESYPIELAEYVVKHDLQEEPAFAWWIPYVLKKRDRMLKKVTSLGIGLERINSEFAYLRALKKRWK